MSLFLLSVAAVNKSMRRPSFREWGLLLFAGIFGTLFNQLFYFTGLQYSTAGNAALIIALSPIATTLLSWRDSGGIKASPLSGRLPARCL
jgi:drug/metabolite transporter (DMT)-like permease